jgi:hypothetical protein
VLVALSAQNFVLLASAVVPPVVAIVVCYTLWRWAKRTDAREAAEAADRAWAARVAAREAAERAAAQAESADNLS